MSRNPNPDSKYYAKTARADQSSLHPNNDSHLHEHGEELGKSGNTCMTERRNKSLLGRTRQEHSWVEGEADSFEKTSSKLFETCFKHHDASACVCDSCNCGRHLCKLKSVKPDLTKNSIYRQSYDRKLPIQNRINRASEYDRLSGPHLDKNTVYSKDFDGKKAEKNQKFRPDDMLKVGGPSQQLTSYSTGFPGFKGANQYVKPTDNIIRADFPLLSRTTYGQSFGPKSTQKPRIEKIPDNLKSRDLWMGKTTYGNFFQQPNPEDYARRDRNREKASNDPNYGHQYETTYKNSFLGPKPSVCPAKIALETRSKGFFSASKDRFAQNADYKALDPAFHAISTSRHFYV